MKAEQERERYRMVTMEYGTPDAPVVLIQMVDEHSIPHLEREVAAIRAHTTEPFRLIAAKVEHWNTDLSPWEAPPVFGGEAFGAGAERTLREVLTLTGDRSKTYILGGYSLAGLFALWTAYQTDAFTAVAAASPSVWFPGFLDYMKANAIHASSVYLSLGDREEKARNPVMASVGERIREVHGLLKEQGVNTILEWNQGNHFKDADIRTAKAFAWVMIGHSTT
jgi:hypothetical protein